MTDCKTKLASSSYLLGICTIKVSILHYPLVGSQSGVSRSNTILHFIQTACVLGEFVDQFMPWPTS